MRGPLVIGLVGGIGSGKSAVSRLLARKGARVIDCDAIVGALLDAPSVRRKLVRAFGPGIRGADGRIDRKALADRAFPDAPALRRLERIVHPPTLREIERELARARRDGIAAVVIDAPLLLETGLHRKCGLTVFVDAPARARARRVAERRGWSRGELARREKRQWPLARKRRMCDTVLPNRGSIADLSRQLDKLWSARIARLISPEGDRSSPLRRKSHV